MNAKEATQLYNDHWDKEFTTWEALFKRIKKLAKNGAYNMCVYVDSKTVYEEVYARLAQEGYGVEHYNDRKASIIEVSWGVS